MPGRAVGLFGCLAGEQKSRRAGEGLSMRYLVPEHGILPCPYCRVVRSSTHDAKPMYLLRTSWTVPDNPGHILLLSGRWRWRDWHSDGEGEIDIQMELEDWHATILGA